jgi:hypothetical protein
MPAAGGAIASCTKALEVRNDKCFRRVTEEGYLYNCFLNTLQLDINFEGRKKSEKSRIFLIYLRELFK